MSKDAYRVTFDQIRKAFEVLGFDADLTTLRELRMEPGRITIERARLNEDGRQFAAGRGELATETVVVAVVKE